MGQISSTLSAPALTDRLARAVSSPPEQVRRTERQVQTQMAEGQLQEALAGRVERLVERMDAVASRITAEKTSAPRRAVLVTRFNELQRQVNELDGIVVAEGQGSRAQQQVDNAAAGQPTQSRRASARPQTSAASAPASASRREKPASGAAVRPQASTPGATAAKNAKVDLLV